jgi:hypothetical protein
MEHDSPIIAFHSGTGRDGEGRRLTEIQAWDDRRLEAVHDFIQWLFPLPERSAFNAAAPILTGNDIDAFNASGELKASLAASFDRMLRFYGFRRVGARIEPAANFAARAAEWLTPGNHNLLRVTRILRSLTLLGLPEAARAFLDALEQLDPVRRHRLGNSPDYWRNACANRAPQR